jgi:hypothetical protein
MLAPPVAAYDLTNGTSSGLGPVVPSYPYSCSDTYIVDAYDPNTPSPERGPVLFMLLYLLGVAEESPDSRLVRTRVEVDGT